MLFLWLFTKIVCPQIKFGLTNESTSYERTHEKLLLNPLELADGTDLGFLRHLREVHNCPLSYKLSLWTILHEIGHYHTLDYCEEDNELEVRAICAMVDRDKAEHCVEIQDLYFNLESEWEATEWAIDYATTHPFLCRIFNHLLP
jgi:hypothetical protein